MNNDGAIVDIRLRPSPVLPLGELLRVGRLLAQQPQAPLPGHLYGRRDPSVPVIAASLYQQQDIRRHQISPFSSAAPGESLRVGRLRAQQPQAPLPGHLYANDNYISPRAEGLIRIYADRINVRK